MKKKFNNKHLFWIIPLVIIILFVVIIAFLFQSIGADIPLISVKNHCVKDGTYGLYGEVYARASSDKNCKCNFLEEKREFLNKDGITIDGYDCANKFGWTIVS